MVGKMNRKIFFIDLGKKLGWIFAGVIGGILASFLFVFVLSPLLATADVGISTAGLINENTTRMVITNIGDRPLENVFVDYKFCYMEQEKRLNIFPIDLYTKGSSALFDIEVSSGQLNTNCSIGTEPIVTKFYRDAHGQCYIQIENVTSNVCGICYLDVNVTADNGFFKHKRILYPYFEISVTLYGGIAKGCLDYELAENKSALIYEPKKDIRMAFFDFGTGCARGDIETEWCQRYLKK